MKVKYLKRFLAIFLSITSLGCCVFAGTPKLSPAIDVLAGELKLTKTFSSGKEATFSAKDFDELIGADIASITILTLPERESGTLLLSGTPVLANQIISRKNISNLTFMPADASEGGSFSFGTVAPSAPINALCELKLCDSLNLSPSLFYTDTLCFSTYEGIALYGKMKANDPEGDGTFFKLSSYPKNGSVFIDKDSGRFIYRPAKDFTGKDSFCYRATDVFGGESKDVMISIDVRNADAALNYVDLAEDEGKAQAMYLDEIGIIKGESFGSAASFYPDRTVTRGQFLLMATELFEHSAFEISVKDPSLLEERFADAEKIPEHLKPYACFAAAQGYIVGIERDGETFFDANEPITRAQAAVVLKKMLKLENTELAIAPTFSDIDSIPAWAQDSVYVLSKYGVYPIDNGSALPATELSRIESALMLCACLEFADK